MLDNRRKRGYNRKQKTIFRVGLCRCAPRGAFFIFWKGGCFLQPTRQSLPAQDLPAFFEIGSGGKLRVNPALLAAAFRERYPYLLVKNDAQEKTWCYVYEDGVYCVKTANEVRGLLKYMIAELDESLVHMRDVRLAYDDLMAEPMAMIPPDELNAAEKLVLFQNGVLELDSGLLLPHASTYHLSVMLPCRFDPHAPLPERFLRFLDDLTGGDRETMRLLLQFLGVTLSNICGYRMKQGLFLYGPGNTGKSVFRNLVINLLGEENTFTVGIDEMEKPFALAGAFGKRMIGDSDLSFLNTREMNNFKKLTGGDRMVFERKGVDRMHAVYRGTVLYCTNRLPHFGGDKGDHVYQRIIPVPCEHVIAPDKQDKQLLESFRGEYAGIVNLALAGAKEVIENGYAYNIPARSRKALEAYRVGNSSPLAFYTECCVPRDAAKGKDGATVSKVYAVYQAWCKDNGLFAEPKKQFEEEIAARLGVKAEEMKEKKRHGWVYGDFTLSFDTKMNYKRIYGEDNIASDE